MVEVLCPRSILVGFFGGKLCSKYALSSVDVLRGHRSHVSIAHDSYDTFRVRERAGFLSVAMPEFVVAVSIRFVIAARDCVTGIRCDDLRLLISAPDVAFPHIPGLAPLSPSSERPTGVFFLLPKTLRDAIYHFGIFEMVSGRCFDVKRSLVALDRLSKVYWTNIAGESEAFFLYTL